jgi:flagellar protein FlaG
MSSQINSIAAGGASAMAASLRAGTPAAEGSHRVASAIQVPDAPKVQAPKHIDIQFDPNKARQSLQEAVSILNQQVKETNRGLGFRMDEILNAPVVTVVSESTGEVVRQIPNEVVVRVAHNIEKMKGFFFNSKA